MKSISRTLTAVSMTALAAVISVVATMPKASAEDWCRKNEHELMSCGFQSKEQCDAMKSGRTGICELNPFPGKAAAHRSIVVYSAAEYAACQSMKIDCVGGGSQALAYLPTRSKRTAHRTH
ncbi:MAG TPA: DUF3551 domain-containing protein [Bradyrhizobium sp.]|nr:DUF3551 domain-containing protein [Bradyrhizobium sp.]